LPRNFLLIAEEPYSIPINGTQMAFFRLTLPLETFFGDLEPFFGHTVETSPQRKHLPPSFCRNGLDCVSSLVAASVTASAGIARDGTPLGQVVLVKISCIMQLAPRQAFGVAARCCNNCEHQCRL